MKKSSLLGNMVPAKISFYATYELQLGVKNSKIDFFYWPRDIIKKGLRKNYTQLHFLLT